MSTSSEVRTELAASTRTRVEIDEDGGLHVLSGEVTLHLDRDACEELATTLARAVIVLARSQPRPRKPKLRLVTSAARSAGNAEGRTGSAPAEGSEG